MTGQTMDEPALIGIKKFRQSSFKGGFVDAGFPGKAHCFKAFAVFKSPFFDNSNAVGHGYGPQAGTFAKCAKRDAGNPIGYNYGLQIDTI
jgi:hypothetical protein